ncbi:MAG: Gfo/Idh/MocA family protein [Planctomycetota bacterium]|jgi:predicted dehydrogenase
MAEKLRWGIIGPGKISRKFAKGLVAVEGAELVAVGSRAKERADKFADEFADSFEVPNRHASYEGVATDPDVDAVYIGTPHPCHKENTLLCLDEGKAVLCEKPFAINLADAEEMLARAAEKKLFLMEAMWTHCFPAMLKVAELVKDGAVGEVRMVKADFAFRGGWDPKSRLLDPELGGGGLLDVGVYPIAFTHLVLGRDPERVTGLAHIGETGVDEQAGIVLGYRRGALAVLTCGVRTSNQHGAAVFGTDGWIEVPPMFWQPDRIVLHAGGKDEEMKFDRVGNGYSYEAAEVARCLREGLTESPLVPHARTRSVMGTMDRLREEWGLKYPME